MGQPRTDSSLRRLLCGAMLTLCCTLASSPLAAFAADTASVKVRETKLRSQPQFWATAVSTLKYGDAVKPVGEEKGWLKVTTQGKSGFVHSSAVSPEKIVLSSAGGKLPTSAERSEVVLAGKGFNQQVEREYSQQNPETNFRAVDEMERIKVSDEELRSFLKQGKLGGL